MWKSRVCCKAGSIGPEKADEFLKCIFNISIHISNMIYFIFVNHVDDKRMNILLAKKFWNTFSLTLVINLSFGTLNYVFRHRPRLFLCLCLGDEVTKNHKLESKSSQIQIIGDK